MEKDWKDIDDKLLVRWRSFKPWAETILSFNIPAGTASEAIGGYGDKPGEKDNASYLPDQFADGALLRWREFRIYQAFLDSVAPVAVPADEKKKDGEKQGADIPPGWWVRWGSLKPFLARLEQAEVDLG